MRIEEIVHKVKRKQVEESDLMQKDVREILRYIEAVKEGLLRFDTRKEV